MNDQLYEFMGIPLYGNFNTKIKVLGKKNVW